MGGNIPIDDKICQMAGKFIQWPSNIPTSSIARPSKIFPKWDFWLEKKPSGNPGCL
jgi:hypothetical protein